MTRMIPARPRNGANVSEKRIFDAFAGAHDADDWIVLHSLEVRRHAAQSQGEADFVVLVPGRGIVVVEAKSPEYVEYKDGDWRLDRVPNPGKSPLAQLDGSIRSLRGYLKSREILTGAEPIARLVWFTSLDRHLFKNGSPGDMQFFEWELAWRSDLQHPIKAINHLLDEHDAWYSRIDEVDHDPTVMTSEHVDEIARALLGDFAGGRSLADRKLERLDDENRLLKEQRVILEMIERNDHVYFDGPAGTGKSYLLAQLANRWRPTHRTLVTCWNLLMAEELRDGLRTQRDIVVDDLNTLMLRIAGIETNPTDAAPSWYWQKLPELALAALRENPKLGDYDAICVDEFQDVASFPAVLDLLFALAPSTGAKIALAGDPHQQILRPSDAHVDPFTVAQARIPGLEHHQAHDIVILSPFGARNSLAGRLLAAENSTKEERWLRDRLRVVPELGVVVPN